MTRSSDYLLALGAGALLAAMVSINSLLAKLTTPLMASWIAHGVGTLVSVILLVTLARRFTIPKTANTTIPIWAYAGGISGALVVVVATIAVNSELGLAATLALGLVGQISFGLLADQFGLLGMPKRQLTLNDLASTLAILAGSLFIILFRA